MDSPKLPMLALSLCPAIDTTLYLDGLRPVQELPVREEHSEAGGKGPNVAAALARLGIDCPCIALTGEENAAAFLRLAREAGVRCLSVPVAGRIRENLSLETPAGQFRVMRRGFSVGEEDLERLGEVLRRVVPPEAFLFAGGKLPDGIAPGRFAALCEALRDRGVQIGLDTAMVTPAEVRRIRPAVMKPNRLELGAITGLPVETRDQVLSAAALLRENGAQSVLVSLDAAGALLMDAEGCLEARAPSVEVRSSVGAGDAMFAWFCAARLSGASREEALRQAVAAGSAACRRYGTRPPEPCDVAELLPQVTLAAPMA